MKILKKFYTVIILVFSSIWIYLFFGKVNVFRTESHKNKVIHSHAKKLEGCFDLENKNQRRINESLDLIKYCMKEFGID